MQLFGGDIVKVLQIPGDGRSVLHADQPGYRLGEEGKYGSVFGDNHSPSTLNQMGDAQAHIFVVVTCNDDIV